MEILNEQNVLKDWSSFITESTGVTEPPKLLWMSKMCQITKAGENEPRINEWNSGFVHLNPAMNIGGIGAMQFPTQGQNGFSGVRDGSGDVPQSNLPIAVQVAAQTIALDLVPVFPMVSPFGVVRYKDVVYEGGRINGDTGYSNGKTDPLMVEAEYITDDAESSDILDPFMAATVNTSVNSEIKLGDYVLTYIKKGFISGKPIFLVSTSHGEFNNSELGKLAGESVATTLAEAGAANNIKFNLVRAKEDHVTAFSGRDFFENSVEKGDSNPYDDAFGIEAYEREDGESQPMNVMSAKYSTSDVKTKTYQVAYTLTWEQMEDAKAFGAGDPAKEAEAELVNELTQSINKAIMSKIYALGLKNATAIAAQGTNLNTLLTLGTETAAGFTQVKVGNGGELQSTIQRRVLDKLLLASNLIHLRGRRGAGTFAVTSIGIATAIQSVAGFAIAPIANTINQTGGNMYPVGQIGGLTIFVDPNLSASSDLVIVGRKVKADEPGIVFCPYIMAAKVAVTPSATLGWKMGMKTRFAIIANGQHPETQYVAFNIKCGKGISLI